MNCVHSKHFIAVNGDSSLSYPACSDSVRSDEKDCQTTSGSSLFVPPRRRAPWSSGTKGLASRSAKESEEYRFTGVHPSSDWRQCGQSVIGSPRRTRIKRALRTHYAAGYRLLSFASLLTKIAVAAGMRARPRIPLGNNASGKSRLSPLVSANYLSGRRDSLLNIIDTARKEASLWATYKEGEELRASLITGARISSMNFVVPSFLRHVTDNDRVCINPARDLPIVGMCILRTIFLPFYVILIFYKSTLLFFALHFILLFLMEMYIQ